MIEIHSAVMNRGDLSTTLCAGEKDGAIRAIRVDQMPSRGL